MELSIFRYILRCSAPQQMCLLWAILAYYPFLYLSLDLPRLTVNRAIGDPVDRTFAAPVSETISSSIWIRSLQSTSCANCSVVSS